MEKKYGVYICQGCGIGTAVDIEKLVNVATKDMKMPFAKTHHVLCSPDGIRMIQNDIKEGANAIVIAACSPRVKYEEFNFPGTITERVNIREFVAWSQPPNTKDTQDLARDYLIMGIVKVRKGDLPEPKIYDDLSRTILVVGGGITGMTAAIEAAGAGQKVVLVEKESRLGGFANKLYKKIPTREFEEPLIVDTGIDSIIKEVENHSNITVYTSSTVAKISGQPGLYEVTISKNDAQKNIKIGVIILAVGWKPYDATKLGHLGYGKFKNVVTNIEFEEIVRKGRITRPSDGKEATRVAFIQCAGQRHPDHLPYCSSMCCATSLKQAKYVRQNPDALAMIFYIDIRTPGRIEAYYREAQNDPGIKLTKADVIGVSDAGNGNLFVEMENTIFGEKKGDTVKVEADLVVLATGMVPVTKDPQEYLDGLAQASAKGDTAKKEYREAHAQPDLILNLDYRQGRSSLHSRAPAVSRTQISFVSPTKQEGQESTRQGVSGNR